MTIFEAAQLLSPDTSIEDLIEALAAARAETVLTPQEAADELRVSVSTLYVLMNEGLPWCPAGESRGRRIYAREMHDWNRSRRGQKQERKESARVLREAGRARAKRSAPTPSAKTGIAPNPINGGTDRSSLLALVGRPRHNSRR